MTEKASTSPYLAPAPEKLQEVYVSAILPKSDTIWRLCGKMAA